MSSKATGSEHLEVKEDLFEDSSNGGVGAVTAVTLVLSLALLFGGIYLQSLAFSISEWALELFVGGLVLEVIAFVIPLTILPRTGK